VASPHVSLLFALLACHAAAPSVEVVVLPDLGDPDRPTEVPAEVTGPGVVLNEVQASNDSTWMAADLTLPDWVELFHAGLEPVDLATVELHDPSGPIWVGEGTLEPGARLLVPVEGIDADGDALELRVGGVVTERIATGLLPADTAWARFPDGGSWSPTARPTPGETNGNAPSATLDPSDALFDTILHFDLTIPPDSWDALGRSPYEEVPASLGFERVWFEEVSVRLKGVYGSFRTLDQKAAFSIDLNEYAGHRLRGLESLKLNNMVQDASYVHEALSYRFFRELGVAAPRTGWARVTVNGEYYGFYAFVEAVDDTFIERWWADPGGNLYEGAYGVDFYVDHAGYFECDECVDPDDRSDLVRVARILDSGASEEALTRLEAVFDMDQFLTEQAAEAILLHWDGYTTANNYRVYHDPITDQFSMIPWGADQTLVDRWYGPYDGYGRLLGWCLAVESCAARYDTILLEAADRFESSDLGLRFFEWRDLVEPEFEADPRREVGSDAHESSLGSTALTLRDGGVWIRDAVEARR